MELLAKMLLLLASSLVSGSFAVEKIIFFSFYPLSPTLIHHSLTQHVHHGHQRLFVAAVVVVFQQNRDLPNKSVYTLTLGFEPPSFVMPFDGSTPISLMKNFRPSTTWLLASRKEEPVTISSSCLLLIICPLSSSPFYSFLLA